MSPQSETKGKRRSKEFTERLNQDIHYAANRMEEESDRVIAYLNDEVVPAIRQKSSKALRIAADRLQELAEYMERNRSK